MISEKSKSNYLSSLSLEDLIDMKKFSSMQLHYWEKTDSVLDYLINVFILRKLHSETRGDEDYEE